MRRLFWGIDTHKEFGAREMSQLKKVRVSAQKKGLEIKWIPQENYHVTLVFLGGVEDEKINPMIKNVERLVASFAPFELKLKGAGAFPEISKGRVVYVDVQAKRELRELQAKLFELLGEFVELEDREYRAHMTLGRLRNKSDLRDILSPIKGGEFGTVVVENVVLFESVLGGAFPVYKPVVSLALGGLQKDVENENQGSV